MIKKIIMAIIILIVLSGCSVIPPIQNATYRVLLIGAGDYDGCDKDLIAPSYAVDSMEELFTRCYHLETLTILKDHNANKKNILDELWYTFKDATEDDISIFYFAGHGGGKDNIFQILPTDYLINGKITITQLEYYLDKIAGNKIIILDSCHSGASIEKDIIRSFNRQGYQVLTSCMGKQVCWEMHGTSFSDPYMVFTRGLLRGCEETYLADTDNDGIITITEVYNYAIDWVSEHSNSEQDAQIYPEGSTFPFVIRGE